MTSGAPPDSATRPTRRVVIALLTVPAGLLLFFAFIFVVAGQSDDERLAEAVRTAGGMYRFERYNVSRVERVLNALHGMPAQGSGHFRFDGAPLTDAWLAENQHLMGHL